MYTVSYFSYIEGAYAETSLCKNREEADNVMQMYIKDVCESEGLEYDEETYKGRAYFEPRLDNGRIYLVKMSRHVKSHTDNELIQDFANALNDASPNRLDDADVEHLADVINNTLSYIDEMNGND